MPEFLSNGVANESPFDQIRHVTRTGNEYWTARELQRALEYDWERFENVLDKAQAACSQAGEKVYDHFRETGKMIATGKGAKREIRDLFLTRHACYLIAMNGDPRTKAAIAEAQAYFAIQTKRQEEQDRLTDEQRRIALRYRVKDGNALLNEAAHASGVEDFGRFQNAGHEGLYGGYDVSNLKKKKKIPPKQDLLDCMGRTELAMNEVRITQTEDKLRRDRVEGESEATSVHQEVGRKVRRAIKDIGGTMPELLPAEPHISTIAKKPENRAIVAGLTKPKTSTGSRLERPAVTPMTHGAKWKPDTRVVIMGVSNGTITEDGLGYQNFANLEAARELFPDLDTHNNTSRFTILRTVSGMNCPVVTQVVVGWMGFNPC